MSCAPFAFVNGYADVGDANATLALRGRVQQSTLERNHTPRECLVGVGECDGEGLVAVDGRQRELRLSERGVGE